jgi:hypothetical protein
MMYSTFARLALLIAATASAQGPPPAAQGPELPGCVDKAATPGEQNAAFNVFLDLLYSKDAAKRNVDKAIGSYYSKDIEDSSPRVDHKPGTMIVSSLAQVAGTLGGIVNNLNVTELKRGFDFTTGIGTSVVTGAPKVDGVQKEPILRRTLTDQYFFGKGNKGACIYKHDDVMTCDMVAPDGKATPASCFPPGQGPPGPGGPPKGPGRRL